MSRTPASQETRAAVQDKVPALTKTIAIIRCLNDLSAGGASLQEIAEQLRITKSHCHNILKTLAREGWVTYDDKRRCYALAPRLLTDVSCLIRARRAPHSMIHEELVRLSRATGTPCVLSRVEQDGSFVAIDKAEETAELTVSVPIGHRFPADAPAQMRVHLAWMAEKPRKHALARWRPHRYTETTIVAKKAAWAELEATRRRGYAVSRAEFSPGVMTLAAPIFDGFGNVQMVLQCPGLIDKVIREEQAIAVELRRSAEHLNMIFGGLSETAGGRI